MLVCITCRRALCKEHVVTSIFVADIHCDVQLSNLPLPVENCILCTSKAEAWSASPSGTTCVVTLDALGLVNSNVDKLVFNLFEASLGKLPGDAVDQYGVVSFRSIYSTLL